MDLNENALEVSFVVFTPIEPRNTATRIVLKIPVVLRTKTHRYEESDAAILDFVVGSLLARMPPECNGSYSADDVVEGRFIFVCAEGLAHKSKVAKSYSLGMSVYTPFRPGLPARFSVCEGVSASCYE